MLFSISMCLQVFKSVVDVNNITYAHYWQSKGFSNKK